MSFELTVIMQINKRVFAMHTKMYLSKYLHKYILALKNYFIAFIYIMSLLSVWDKYMENWDRVPFLGCGVPALLRM